MPDEPLPPRKAEPSERELRAMLENRERELADKLKGQTKIVPRVLGIAVVLFVAWAGYVYVTNQRKFAEDQAARRASPEKIAPTKPGQKLINDGDAKFANEFMDFMQLGKGRPPSPKKE